MRQHKVHWIGSVLKSGWQSTACGMMGWATSVADEYDTEDSSRFEAKYHDWKGVTCGRCLKNPHAPKAK